MISFFFPTNPPLGRDVLAWEVENCDGSDRLSFDIAQLPKIVQLSQWLRFLCAYSILHAIRQAADLLLPPPERCHALNKKRGGGGILKGTKHKPGATEHEIDNIQVFLLNVSAVVVSYKPTNYSRKIYDINDLSLF